MFQANGVDDRAHLSGAITQSYHIIPQCKIAVRAKFQSP